MHCLHKFSLTETTTHELYATVLGPFHLLYISFCYTNMENQKTIYYLHKLA